MLSELCSGPLAYLWMGPTLNAVYAMPSCTLWLRLSSASPTDTQYLECRYSSVLPGSASVLFRLYPLVSTSSSCQTSLRYSGDALTFVAAECKRDCRGLASKFCAFTALVEKLQQHGFCKLLTCKAVVRPNKENLFTRILVEF